MPSTETDFPDGGLTSSQLARAAALHPPPPTPPPPSSSSSIFSFRKKHHHHHQQQQPAAASHIVVPHDSAVEDPAKRIDLATALQYGQADGYPPLLSFIRQFTRENLHPDVPYEGGPEVILTVGATDGMAKALELFVNSWVPGKNDPRDRPGLLTEVFMYSNVLAQVSFFSFA